MVIKENIIAIPPGESIKDQLKNRSMTQKEFALRMGMSEKHISHLCNGKVPLTQETSLKLESVLGVPAHFWNNLEALFQEDLARIHQLTELEKEKELLNKFPVSELSKQGFIDSTKDDNDTVIQLRHFFGVASLLYISKVGVFKKFLQTNNNDNSFDYTSATKQQINIISSR